MAFDYTKKLTNPEDYPTEPQDEQAARQQFQELFDEIKDAHNSLDNKVDGLSSDAEDINYDNSQSGLAADNVQAAIDEHLADIAILNFGFNNAGFHNSIYRGKFLGNSVSAAQWLEIEAGTFKDMFIGDYWTIGGKDYVIVAFDYYFNSGFSYKVTSHHVVIMPRANLYTHKMNNTSTTEGGYLGSLMYSSGLDSAKVTIKTAFNNRILKHEQFLTNGYDANGITAVAWVESEVELCNEVMVLGTQAFGSHIYSSGRAVGICKSQLPIFALRPDFANIAAPWWLRDPISATYFAIMGSGGNANYNSASSAFGVRPAFSIS